jgi:hypothetical protein
MNFANGPHRLIKFMSLYYILSLDLKQPTLTTSACSDENLGEIPVNKSAAAAKASTSSHTISSSLDTADTFHTACSLCSVAGEHDPVTCEAKRPSIQQENAAVVACVGPDDSDELSSTEDSCLRAAVGSTNVTDSLLFNIHYHHYLPCNCIPTN